MKWAKGQSTVEMAVTLPFLALLLALSLEGGVVISDQLSLDQYAYDGAQWAVSHPGTATPGSAGTIAQHVYASLCGGATDQMSGATAPGTTRFCAAPPAGVPPLSVSVTTVGTPTALLEPRSMVLAASSCPSWALSTPQKSLTVVAGNEADISVSTSTTAGGAAANVRLYGGAFPPGLMEAPRFQPPSVTTDPAGGVQASVLALKTTGQTPPGQYRVVVSGEDQCGYAAPDVEVVVTVTGGGPMPTPSPLTPGAPSVLGVNPSKTCVGVVTLITVEGTGFQPGATVTAGTQSTSVQSVSPEKIVFSYLGAATGVVNVVVNNPDGTKAYGGSALVVGTQCAPPPPPPFVANACASGAGKMETVITITWAETLIVPLLSGSSPPFVRLKAYRVAFCQ